VKRLRVLLPLLALLVLPRPARAHHEGTPCGGHVLPSALNLGLPRLPSAPGFDARGLEGQIQTLLERIYEDEALCPGSVEVNIAMGSEYEILDWLGQSLIDAALVPDLTLYLLQRDGVNLRELKLNADDEGLVEERQARLLAGRLSGRRWAGRGDPQADYAAFRDRVLAAARERAGDSGWDAERYWTEHKDSAGIGYRIVLASHLSSTGFLAPVADVHRWLEARLAGEPDQAARDRLREFFWQVFFENARFAVHCDSLDRPAPSGRRSCWDLPRGEEEKGEGPVEVLFPGEAVIRWHQRDHHADPGLPFGDRFYREHLVVTPRTAEALFQPAACTVPQPDLLGLAALFEDSDGEKGKDDPGPPRAFLSMLQPEPSFGTRAFRFTVDESLRLLRQDQAMQRGSEMALVLPGGGVKAAYQSRIVDELYRDGRYLKNFDTTIAGRDPLNVDYVIGTSGGALLGFFVAQLRENGPWNLTSTLWTRDGKKAYLRSTDIFGWTDLLRYVSIVTGFLVLCLFLAIFSLPEHAALNPRRRPRTPAWRLRLSLAVLPLLLLAPLLVRVVNERAHQEEQVPAIEGLIYAVLAMCAMFADQCLVVERGPRPKGKPWFGPGVPLALGGPLVALPLIAALSHQKHAGPEDHWFAQQVTFGLAFGVLAPLVLVAGLIVPLRMRSRASGLAGLFGLALQVVVPMLLALSMVPLLGAEGMAVIKIPFFISGLLIVLVAVGAIHFLGPKRRYLRGPGWWTAYAASLLLASFLVLNLAWPDKQVASLADAFALPTLDIPVGTLLLCLGLCFLLFGGLALTYGSGKSYRLRMPRNFLSAFFFVLAHAVAVSVVLFSIILALPDWLSPLELTGQYWRWLLLTSAVFGLGLVLYGIYGKGGRGLFLLRRGLVYLCSHHPNGDFVTRRFLRLAVLSVFALVWWNLIVAPALYGNATAQKYLNDAVVRFLDLDKVRVAASNPESLHREPPFVFAPTSRFIAPANILEKDGTRYYLFVPHGDDCPFIPNRPASGAQWKRFRMDSAKAVEGEGCRPVPADKLQNLKNVIFASGSPFPIFPAHRVPSLDPEEPVDADDTPSLVDGGYSNNIPVDAARTVSAEQVLIIESSNPLGPEAPIAPAGGWRMPKLTGKLVENLGRLPSFLFERSQQVDRLSRLDLFVVSLSPSRDWGNWPPLFDFRDTTVQRMERLADVDLHLRTGMVQSWGRPSFPLNVQVTKKEGL
jgi:predicted acylesterase/phospholipase RssA